MTKYDKAKAIREAVRKVLSKPGSSKKATIARLTETRRKDD